MNDRERTPKRAILLLAGAGRRLGALTEDRPKCLVEVEGASILERSLRALAGHGVEEAVLVVGYRSDRVEAFAGGTLEGMRLSYVRNEAYAETNTAYSLWLARESLDERVLLLEGDILFDPAALERLCSAAGEDSAWAANPVGPRRNEGILLGTSAEGRIDRVTLVRNPETRDAGLTHKCGGIQSLSASMARALATRLDEVVPDGGRRVFADLVLGELLHIEPVRLCSLAGTPWAEIDDPLDLARARSAFGADRLRRASHA